ncbi:hypothetical protein [Sphingomonas sp. M1-B02]|uniref:hypothetical protein n=1 Tax=Sphingomonas sp. M1-B02 TaxID=3114300 RepID=UPI002240B63C|nr:hypothetical protein [Sphingomonas sp. S6-11]UZK66420.1 hypothetical protein OKW87_00845 [Sphingomonas sp. S6-11]
MRKITPRDWLALAVPAVGILVLAVTTVRSKGWIVGLILTGTMSAFIVGYWVYCIRKYPDDTWRARL